MSTLFVCVGKVKVRICILAKEASDIKILAIQLGHKICWSSNEKCFWTSYIVFLEV